ncbi:MAG: sigma-70 family RNA polymerase sigma factor [Planctomycetota bacterium]|jgi:RNA polymerase sigma-70 factor (ECF subfamily)
MTEGGESWAAERVRTWNSSRSPEALGELLKWQRDRAYAIARRILGSEADAEDAVQEAFTKLLAAAPEFGSADEFRAIVIRSASQRAIDLARKLKARGSLEKAMRREGLAASGPASAGAERAEALEALQTELASVAPEDRALLALCCQESRRVSEAAHDLGMARETARDRLKSILSDLRGRLSRKGIGLALLPLVALLGEGRGARAGEALCSGLDAALPGASCASVPAAAAAVTSPATLLSELGLAGSLTLKLGALAAVLAAVVSGAFIWHSVTGYAPPSRPAAVTAPAPAPAPEEVTPPAAEPRPAPRPAPVLRPAQFPERGEVRIPLRELPAEVRSAVQGAMDGIVLIEAEMETARGRQVYEIEGRVGDRLYEIRVTPDGKVIAVEEDDEDEDDEDEDDDEPEQEPEKIEKEPREGAPGPGPEPPPADKF